ncbi:IS1634 family transposase [Gaoshiqia sp. Z1-71]|uniref:IS1634 family transposase n=1 Tax=Gaoshiqia hydrogeniformans TaxID=3290090 RepID=UPI003BF91AC3
MFVRRKANKTGSVSVHVIDKSQRRYRVIKSFGTGRTEAEIVRLEEKARQYIREQTGMSLSLFEDEDEIKLEGFLSNISNSQIQVIGPELVFGTLYDRVGYGRIDNELFRHLVITRLFNPGSKLKTIDYLLRYQGIVYNISRIYRFLDNLCLRKEEERGNGRTDIKNQVEEITYFHTLHVLGGRVEVVFYDMTTLYFEASDEDDLRKTGFSKDGKHQCPQIFLGLLVGHAGNPIGYELFEGNIFEGDTFIPVLQRMEKRFNLGKPVVIADSGLLSKKNILALEANGYQYILGARPKNESGAIKQKILAFDLKDGDVRIINKAGGKRLILSKTDKRAAKDAHNRKRGLDRLTKRMNSGKLTKSNINNKGYNKYLKMEGEIIISIDLEKFHADAAWDGIKAYLTNTALPAKKVIANYRNLWFIERAFRMNKTDLRVRPVFHRLYNRIEAHICICFTAYTIMLELERLLKAKKSSLSLKRAQEITHNMYQIVYQLPHSKDTKTQILKMDREQQELYDIIVRSKQID